jgi:hypothetical protein
MAEVLSLSKRSVNALRQDGVSGFLRQGVLYLLRRIAWTTDEWSKNLAIGLQGNRLRREFGPLLKRNEVFRNLHKGRRCFIIGNGPSIKDQDLSPLANEITLVTNSFHVHPIIGDSWQPTYYFLSDPMYFDGSVDCSAEFASINSRITSAPFFVPSYAHNFLTESNSLPAERTYYVAVGAVRPDSREVPDLTSVTLGVQTVVQLAMMAAMFMGCSPMYLIGCDHDWLAQRAEDHFYNNSEVQTETEAQSYPWTYASLMGAVTIMWEVYLVLKNIADAADIEIINCTHGGFLDVFKRARYEDVVSAKNGASI